MSIVIRRTVFTLLAIAVLTVGAAKRQLMMVSLGFVAGYTILFTPAGAVAVTTRDPQAAVSRSKRGLHSGGALRLVSWEGWTSTADR